MKKQLFLTFTLALMVSVCFANPVDRNKALRVADNFWHLMDGKNTPTSWIDVSANSPFSEFYIFINELGRGFVLVSADDCVLPIIGYSTDENFTFPIPVHVRGALSRYEEEIAYCKENQIAGTEYITSLWNDIYNNTYTPAMRSSVAPLLTTKWNQDEPYNNLCPNGGTENVPAGCTAIATAQIMKYWNWPATGVGSNSFVHNLYGLQYADFANTNYDWGNMPNKFISTSTDAERLAVATLVYHVGVSVNMNYTPDGSGAYTTGIPWPSAENALRDCFCYSESLHAVEKEKDSINDEDWMDILITELNAGRPMIEAGHTSDESGHAFVCDGYNNAGLFHINWGWGGSYDGYFHPMSLNPGSMGSFNHHMSLVVGIEPNYSLHANPKTLDFAYEGGNQTLTISPNADSAQTWNATADQSWVTLSKTSGSNMPDHQLVNVTTAANPTDEVRFANIVIAQGNQSDTVVVRQAFDCDTLYYCYGTYHGEQGPKGTDTCVYWGIRLDTARLVHVTTLHAVQFWIRLGGTYELRIYQGGEDAPDSLIYCDSVTSPELRDWYEIELPIPLSIDNTKDLWITFYNRGTSTPISGCYYYGEPDGSWISYDGENWSTLTQGEKAIAWFIRAVVTGDADCENVFSDEYQTAEGSYTWHGTTYTYSGEYSYVVSNVVGNNCDSVETLHLTLTGTGISSLELEKIRVYPNPTSGIVTIEGSDVERVEIFDLMGQQVAIFDHKQQINLTSMASGIYMLRVSTPIGIYVKQIIKY